jgi:hypothetical protein
LLAIRLKFVTDFNRSELRKTLNQFDESSVGFSASPPLVTGGSAPMISFLTRFPF